MSYPFIQPKKEKDDGIENRDGNFKKKYICIYQF